MFSSDCHMTSQGVGEDCREHAGCGEEHTRVEGQDCLLGQGRGAERKLPSADGVRCTMTVPNSSVLPCLLCALCDCFLCCLPCTCTHTHTQISPSHVSPHHTITPHTYYPLNTSPMHTPTPWQGYWYSVWLDIGQHGVLQEGTGSAGA